MKRTHLVPLVLWSAVLQASSVVAQDHSAALPTPSFNSQDPCRAAVSKFEQAISFVRQSQGAQAASALKEKLLPAKQANDILLKDGYCGIARYLHEKKLDR